MMRRQLLRLAGTLLCSPVLVARLSMQA